MIRAPVTAATLLTIFLVGGPDSGSHAASSAPAASPASGPVTSAKRPPTFGVPRPAGLDTAAVWDTLAALEQDRRWTASESVATVLANRLANASRPDSLDLSRAWLYVANGLVKQRRYGDGRAFDAFDRAVGVRERHTRAPDRLVMWAHLVAASAYEDADQHNRALREGRRALQLLEQPGARDSVYLSQAHLAMGQIFDDIGDGDSAGVHFETALALRVGLDGPDGLLVAPIMASYGLMLANQGEFDPGRDRLTRALAITEEHPEAGTELMEGVLGRLSTVEDRVGDIEQSLDYAERAYVLSRRRLGEDGVVPLRLRAMQAFRLQEFGDMAGSAALLDSVVPALAAALGNANANAINTRLSYANALVVTGDTTAAGAELAKARAGLAAQADPPKYDNNRVFCLQVAGDLEHARGHHAAARESLEVAIAIEWQRRGHTGGRRGILYRHWYDTVTGSGERADLPRAARDIDRLTDSTSIRATSVWEPMVAARAAAEGRVGWRDSAWTHALEAESISRQDLQYQLQVLPDRRALQLAGVLGTPCDLLVALQRPGRSDDLAIAWDRVVRWRGLVRHEIARRRVPIGATGDTAIAGTYARWITAQRRLAQLVVSGAAHPHDPESAALYESARRDAETAESRYVRMTRNTIPAADSVTLDEVLGRVGAGETLVGFALGSIGPGTETLGAFVASGPGGHPRWVALGPATDRAREVRDWLRALSTPPADAHDAASEEGRCRRLGEVVRERIWDPIRRAAPGTRVWDLVPEASTTGIPWLALPVASRAYLADSAAVIRVLDAERDLLPAPAPAPFHGHGLLAVGGPNFDLGEAAPDTAAPTLFALRARQWPCSGSAPLSLPPLPAARAEAEGIARDWHDVSGPARLMVGDEADEARVKANASGHAVIHIATHGIVVEDTCSTISAQGTRGIGAVTAATSGTSFRRSGPRPVGSGPPASPWLGRQVWLALAGANRPPTASGDENEGLLTAEEIVTLDLRGTDWVVLSACHSGAAPAWAREGVLGMQRAFHLAGARAVIASRWGVGDESTREWMSALYAARDRGETASAAVQSACRTVLAARRSSRRPTHPFYWAAFGASGE
jgi:CHAT domain-containing protein